MSDRRSLKFYQADVFTGQPFGGNPVAVFPDAHGLADYQLQRIAREMNLSETVFVLPPMDQAAVVRATGETIGNGSVRAAKKLGNHLIDNFVANAEHPTEAAVRLIPMHRLDGQQHVSGEDHHERDGVAQRQPPPAMREPRELKDGQHQDQRKGVGFEE